MGTLLSILRIAYPYIIGVLIGGYAAWWVQGARVDYLNVELTAAKSSLSICQDANMTNQATIKNLKDEVLHANSLCESRLSGNAALLKRLRDIDNLKISGGQDEKSGHSDPLLRELNGMFPVEADRKN